MSGQGKDGNTSMKFSANTKGQTAECPGLGEDAQQSCSSLGALPLELFLPGSAHGNGFSPCTLSCGQRFQKGLHIL